MAVTVKGLSGLKPGKYLSDGPAGVGRGSGSLVFRRTSTGAILAYYRYTRSDGERDPMPIGSYDESGRAGMTLTEARIRAGELAKLYQSGIQNIREFLEAEKRKAEDAIHAEQEAEEIKRLAELAQKKYTLRALCEAYVEHLKYKGKDKSASQTRSSFKCHLLPHTEIVNLPARDVTSEELAKIIRSVYSDGKERAAGVLRSYLSAAYTLARTSSLDAQIPEHFKEFRVKTNPVTEIKAIPVRAGERTLSAKELRDYYLSITDDVPNLALKLALLTGGQRIEQILRAKISDYDKEMQTLRLWDSKGRRSSAREHLIPLTHQTTAIVEILVARANAIGTKFLFSTNGKVQMNATTISKLIPEIRTTESMEHFDLRDIRRTCETMLAKLQIPKHIRAQLLSHGLGGVQDKHYDKHQYLQEKLDALITWEERLKTICN